MNVYSYEEFIKNEEVLMGDEDTAIEFEHNGKTTILPVRQLTTTESFPSPGVYVGDNPFVFLSYPVNEEEEKIYCPGPECIFDMKDINSIQEYVTRKEEFDNTAAQLLETDPENDSVYKPPLLKTDSPEMRALKESIIAKGVDIDKYAPRFGDNFPNDKRKMKDDNITSYMLKRICDNLDIEVDMVFRDASGDIANPMNKVVRVNMVPGYGNHVSIEPASHSKVTFEEDDKDNE